MNWLKAITISFLVFILIILLGGGLIYLFYYLPGFNLLILVGVLMFVFLTLAIKDSLDNK
jgi:hypothetical protein